MASLYTGYQAYNGKPIYGLNTNWKGQLRKRGIPLSGTIGNNSGTNVFDIDNIDTFKNAKYEDVQRYLDEILKGYTKSPLKRGNGVRYYDGRGNSWQINQGYPNSTDSIHGGPYLKTTYRGKIIRIPLRQ